MIVGQRRADELERCLKSALSSTLFDEVVVVQTQEDPEVAAVIQKWGVKTAFFPWCDDFAAARNFSLDHLTTDWWMWLDSDDEIQHTEMLKFLRIKKELGGLDEQGFKVVEIQYNYAHLADGSPTSEHSRERILKRTPEHRWAYPVHEYVKHEMGKHSPSRVYENVAVDHYRTGGHDLERNLRILRKAVSETADPRMRFYLAKDLCEAGRFGEGVPIAETLLEEGSPYPENIAVLCRILCGYYMDIGDQDAKVRSARRGIKAVPYFAEFWCILGADAMSKGKGEEGRLFYQMALACRTRDLRHATFASNYMSIPARELAAYEASQGRFVSALMYNKLLLDSKDIDIMGAGQFEERNRLWTALEPVVRAAANGEPPLGNRFAVAWLMSSLDLTNPSTRVRRYRVHEELLNQGRDSFVVTDYHQQPVEKTLSDLRNASVVVFTIFGQVELTLMRALRARGVGVLFDHCEELFGFPFEDECMAEADTIVCCSTELMRKTVARGFKHCVVVRDAYENGGGREFTDSLLAVAEYAKNEGRKPRAVYMGMGGNSFLAHDVLRSTVEAAGYELVVISEWNNATIKWSQETWLQDFLSCDVALCPQREGIQDSKSNIKVTTAMALGMPVIASPIPSYREIITHGKDGFLCSIFEPRAWGEALEELKDQARRKEVGRSGLERIRGEYSIQNITSGWLDAMTAQRDSRAKDAVVSREIKAPVDLVIAVYNNAEYVKLTVASIHLNTDYPYRIIISDAGSGEETWKYLRTLQGVLIIGRPGLRKSFSQACNDGILAGTSKYVAVLNSDLVLSKGWLSAVVDKLEKIDRLGACGVLSNCDSEWLWKGMDFSVQLHDQSYLPLHPGMKMEAVFPHLQDLYQYMQESNIRYAGKFIERDWIAGYCYVFARTALSEVGLHDPVFKNGCEDLDLCRRLRLAGYNIGQAMDAFVFHFGGVSRGAYELEDVMQSKGDGQELTPYQIEDQRNHIIYHAKWARKKIGIYTGPGWERWSEKTVATGMGGSETWAAELAAEFSRRGYLVQVFGDPEEEHIDEHGVVWRRHENMKDWLEFDYLDAFIASRTCEPLRGTLHSLQNFVMVHDVFINPKRDYDREDWKVKKYACLSEWHRNFLQEYHGIASEKLFLTHNGVDQSLYGGFDLSQKRNRTVYSSSADRGLLELLIMLPEIRKAVPDFEVDVCYGFDNWEKASLRRQDPKELDHMQRVKHLLRTTEGVVYHGRVSKQRLAELQCQAKVWLYPTWFHETFCIGAVENGLAYNAILTSDLAGLKTTVEGHGILLGGYGEFGGPHPDAYRQRFIGYAIEFLNGKREEEGWGHLAYQKAKQYTWAEAADGWLKEFGWT